jgi:hypothetical protein
MLNSFIQTEKVYTNKRKGTKKNEKIQQLKNHIHRYEKGLQY